MYIGIDTHKDICIANDLPEQGDAGTEFKIKNTLQGWQKFLKRIPKSSVIVIEASTVSCPIYDFLTDNEYQVEVANPCEIPQIGKSRNKTDRRDSLILAQLLRSDFLPKATIPAREIRAERELHRQRILLGEKRGKVQTQVKSLISRAVILDETINIKDVLTGKTREDLDKLDLRVSERFVLDQLLSEIDFQNDQIKQADSELRKRAQKNEMVWLLMTIPGVSYYSAMTVVNEVGDISRFKNSKKFCSYIGIVPSVYQSGSKEITGRITKKGNRFLRWMLNQCVVSTVRQDSPIKEFYQRMLKRKGLGKSKIAAERKLATVIFHMMKNMEEYRYQDRDLTITKWRRVYGKSLRPHCPPSAGTI